MATNEEIERRLLEEIRRNHRLREELRIVIDRKDERGLKRVWERILAAAGLGAITWGVDGYLDWLFGLTDT